MHLWNFRGVEDREVAFAPSGVTVIEGPNEIGKSTIAEALALLIDAQDSSTKQQIKDVKPVHRDASPEVELEAESGAFAFRYRKRFLRGASTTLAITRPVPQNLTGKEAHDKVLAILADTADLNLWRALRLDQGERVGQVSLERKGWLVSALDRAAGTVQFGPAETSLWDRVQAEYREFFTDTGKQRGDAAKHADAVAQLESSLREVRTKLASLETDVARLADLRRELADLVGDAVRAAASVERHTAGWQRIQTLAAEVAAREAQAETATLEAQQRAKALAERRLLTAEVEQLAAQTTALAVTVADRADVLARAKERAKVAAGAVAAARAAKAAAAAAARESREALDLLRARKTLAALLERRAAVVSARDDLAKAQAAVSAGRIDAPGLARLREAELAVARARAVLGAARPSVEVTALRPVTVELDGVPVALAANQVEQHPVEGELSVVLPGTMTVRVTAGSGGDQAARAAATAEAALATMLAEAGVADVAEADRRVREREAAAGVQAAGRARLTELLGGDLERGQTALDARIAHERQQVADAGDAPVGDLDLLIDAAAAVQAEDQRLALEADDAVARAEPEDVAAAARVIDLEKDLAVERTRAEGLAGQEAERRGQLDAARAIAPDADVEALDGTAAAAAVEASARAVAARAELTTEGPEVAQALLDNALDVQRGIEDRIRGDEKELAAVQARLRDHGEEGLAELRDQLDAKLGAAVRDRDAYTRAAAARRVLFGALKAARDEANRAYVGPLRDRVEDLAKIVFGAGVQIRLNEDLQISERTLDGVTLPYDQLSVGAREQLAVIGRLACGILVAPDGGIPVILDDGLGWSDQHRLESMGAVLRKAGETCQIIVLTCYPDRYRSVGGATVVKLP